MEAPFDPDAFRLLEAATETLRVAVSGLGSAKSRNYQTEDVDIVPEVGLIGSAAELLMGACLVAAHGTSALLRRSGRYLTFDSIRREFIGLVQNRQEAAAFMFNGVVDPELHGVKLLQCARRMAPLVPIRAGALHAGRGIVHEAAVAKANEVADFLDLLRESQTIGPHLQVAPRCRLYARDRVLLVEDLRSRLASDASDGSAIASLFLVLPDIPDDEPEWLKSLSRVTIAPAERDRTYLLSVLDKALPVTLRTSGSATDFLPVVVRQGDPGAVPVSPFFLKKSLSSIKEQWLADRMNANGRLNKGILHLPPQKAIAAVFAMGLDDTEILEKGEIFTAHDVWPFVAASLSVQGTPGPFWFLLRRSKDHGQLLTLLESAAKLGGNYLRQRLADFRAGIEALGRNRPISRSSELAVQHLLWREKSHEMYRSLPVRQARHRNKELGLPQELAILLDEVMEQEAGASELLDAVRKAERISEKAVRYWQGILCTACHKPADVPVLVEVLEDSNMYPAHSEAKKSLLGIDFEHFGPSLT